MKEEADPCIDVRDVTTRLNNPTFKCFTHLS